MLPNHTTSMTATIDGEADAKRVKRAVEDEYTCPITAELFVEPVTAADGRVYERNALVRWFRETTSPVDVDMAGDFTKSPVTNAPMGKAVLPAHQVKSALARLIEAETITGERVDAWKAAMAAVATDREQVASLKKRTEAGDAEAAMELFDAYEEGRLGLDKERDQQETFKWTLAAAREGHAIASRMTGKAYEQSLGVDNDPRRGREFLFLAAILGSEDACAEMARRCSASFLDREEALFWLRKMDTCKYKDATESVRKRSREDLARRLPRGARSAARA